MSAREKIAQFFPGLTGYNVADEILTEHTRELIAQIRQAIADGAGNDWDWWDAATIPESVLALIDPDTK